MCRPPTCVCVCALQVIVVVVITILTDVVQLGLYFPEAQRQNGAGTSELINVKCSSDGNALL